MTKEKKFYDTLKDIFVGAKLEGESGYINLMRIKSRYYEKGVFPKLQKDINEALKPFPDFREELFEKLYTFFQRYFSESGSIYFRYTPLHQNVYEKVYTDDKDVMLFWKTHMLYYVKTDRLFKNLKVEVDNIIFFFDVSKLEYKRANEKKAIVYEFKEKREEGTIVFSVYYSERGKKTKIIDTLRALKKEGININEDTLEEAFRVFEKQNEVDYFINKDAKKFLKEQFDIWLYQYVFSGESEWSEERIKQLQILKDIAFKIINFISQFEDELVKIWNKPKFVLNSNYVITLDRIVSAYHCKARSGEAISLVEKILNHKNVEEQITEWKKLGIVADNFNKYEILENNLMGTQLNQKYKHLPIDTKYFKDLELEILGLFDDLDNSLDGWLIKSENYQALNTILPKFKEKVQTIYIDPPFNKESDADYFYSVKYKNASWITLLENRLRFAKDILNLKGSIFVRCDYNGNMFVRLLMNEIFGEENFRNEIIISRTRAKQEVENQFIQQTESLFFYSKEDQIDLKTIERTKTPEWHPLLHFPRADDKPRIILGKEFYPPKGRRWALSQGRIDKFAEKDKIRVNGDLIYIDCRGKWVKGIPELLYDFEVVGNEWLDIPGYSQVQHFPTENSEILLKRVIESTSNTPSNSPLGKGWQAKPDGVFTDTSFKEGNKDIIMDFFLGSGTTTTVSHKLKRKWLGVEMGEHFYDVILPRMKKVLFYDKSGISSEKDVKERYNPQNAGGFFKYYEIEQYEDTLRKVKYQDSNLFDNPYEDPYNQYVFMRDSKMLEALEIDYKNNKVKVNLSSLYPPSNSPLSKGGYGGIDIPETLSNLLGKWINKITPDFVEFEDGEKINIKDLDYKLIKPLIWWKL